MKMKSVKSSIFAMNESYAPIVEKSNHSTRCLVWQSICRENKNLLKSVIFKIGNEVERGIVGETI